MQFIRRLRRHLKEQVRWLIPFIQFELIPQTGCRKDNGGSWRLIAEKAEWRLKPTPPIEACGWYLVEIQATTDASRFDLQLLTRHGSNLEHETIINFPIGSSGLKRRVCWFPKPAEHLQLNAVSLDGDLLHLRLRMLKLPQPIAWRYVMRRLRSAHPAFSPGRSLPQRIVQHPYGKKGWVYEEFQSTFVPYSYTPDYQDWIRYHELPDIGPVEAAADPKISLLLCVQHGNDEYLNRCLRSIHAQQSQNWELCIGLSTIADQQLRTQLNSLSERDSRVRIIQAEGATETGTLLALAFSHATGDWIVCLQQDAVLSDNALTEIGRTLAQNPELQIIYSDEDQIDQNDQRANPHFKPDWNSAQILSHHYVGNLCAFRHDLVSRVGGLRPEMEQALGYDLLLRCSAPLTAHHIGHIPKVLYHRQVMQSETDSNLAAALYSGEAGARALRDYFQQQGELVEVQAHPEKFCYRVVYPLKKRPLVSLIIPTRDHVQVLRTCIDSILQRTHYPNYEILVVDNQSNEPETLEYLKQVTEDPRISVVEYNQAFNYSAINNFAVTQAKGEIIGLINNDVEVINSDWLDEMLSLAMRPENGCIGAKLYYPDDSIQHAGVILGLGRLAGHAHRDYAADATGYFNRLNVRQNLSAVTAACLLVRREIYEEVGGLDEAFVVAYNDVDFCIRVREAGYLNVFTPFAELYHYESKSRGQDDTPEKKARFNREKTLLQQRWAKLLAADHYYNPNLTRLREDFSVAWPHEK